MEKTIDSLKSTVNALSTEAMQQTKGGRTLVAEWIQGNRRYQKWQLESGEFIIIDDVVGQ